jgi:hypothetical protein
MENNALWGMGLVIGLAACGGSPPATPSSQAWPDTVRLGISHDGTTMFGGKKVAGEELTNAAREAQRSQPNLKVVVDAEREVSYQNVLAAVERVKAGGASNITFGSMLASPPTGVSTTTSATTPAGHQPVTGPTPEPHAAIPPGTKWDCPFPPQEERGGKEEASVLVRVHVEKDGKPLSVDIMEDPGAGFSAAAKKCALEKAYLAARDVNNQPIRSTTFPFYVHFVTK